MQWAHLLSADHRPKVTFENEIGIDAGGLMREWYSLVLKDLILPEVGVFELAPGCHNEYTLKAYHNGMPPGHVEKLLFAGKFIARAIADHQPLGVSFTHSVYRSILGEAVGLRDLKSDDRELFDSLQQMRSFDEAQMSGLWLTFGITIFDDYTQKPVTVDLIPDGSNKDVTTTNREEYIDAVVQYRLKTRVSDQVEPFVRGFHSILTIEFMQSQQWSLEELHNAITGSLLVDVEDLISNLWYNGEPAPTDGSVNPAGYVRTHTQIQWLHDELRQYSQDQLRLFLKFVTGTDQVPAGGFKDLRNSLNNKAAISIHRRDYEKDRLPTSWTCYFSLYLPEYPDQAELAAKLSYAIGHANGGFGLA